MKAHRAFSNKHDKHPQNLLIEATGLTVIWCHTQCQSVPNKIGSLCKIHEKKPMQHSVLSMKPSRVYLYKNHPASTHSMTNISTNYSTPEYSQDIKGTSGVYTALSQNLILPALTQQIACLEKDFVSLKQKLHGDCINHHLLKKVRGQTGSQAGIKKYTRIKNKSTS